MCRSPVRTAASASASRSSGTSSNLHGGKVQAQSEGRGRGAVFAVHLPVRAIQQPTVPESTHAQPLGGLKVLVVDDDADARESVSLALAQCGARTAAVGSAREACIMLGDFKPDVLVSDIGMPDEDGCAFIRRVRSLNQHGLADVPAVALTGYAQPEDQRRALLAGFQEFVPKPVHVDELAVGGEESRRSTDRLNAWPGLKTRPCD